ncbi:MAG: hypothetical protein QNJ30_27440 [Kiloniellales bacterium]|nr:hypothetical protein [Kiloniellales bacterium]
MSTRFASRLWMAWSLVLLVAMAGVSWHAARATAPLNGREVVAPVRGGLERLKAAGPRIEAIAIEAEGYSNELSRIAQRQLPRSPFGLEEPPFLQEMRAREEGLLAALTGIRDQLRDSKRQLVDLQSQLDTLESSMQADLDGLQNQIGLLQEVSDAQRDLTGFALAVIAALGALSTLVLARQAERRAGRQTGGEETAGAESR